MRRWVEEVAAAEEDFTRALVVCHLEVDVEHHKVFQAGSLSNDAMPRMTSMMSFFTMRAPVRKNQ